MLSEAVCPGITSYRNMPFMTLIELIKIKNHPAFLLGISQFHVGESVPYSNAISQLGMIISNISNFVE